MYIDVDTIIKAAAVLGAVLAIGTFIWGIILWVQKREKTTKELAVLKEIHTEDISSLKEELCVLSYAMLATLEGLKQLNCNGPVTEAYNRLSKHLNKQAHDQI